MSWEEEQARLEEHRRRLAYVAVFGGEVMGGRECVLEVHVSRPYGAPDQGGILVPPRKATAIIDTGCTDTAIRYELAAEIGLPVIGQKEVDTASSGEGSVMCPTVLAALHLRDLRGREIVTQRELTAHDMKDDILFGMDLLAGGILTVDLVGLRWDLKYHTLESKPVRSA